MVCDGWFQAERGLGGGSWCVYGVEVIGLIGRARRGDEKRMFGSHRGRKGRSGGDLEEELINVFEMGGRRGGKKVEAASKSVW